MPDIDWKSKNTSVAQPAIGVEIKTEVNAGTSFPDNLSQYRLIIHCGACMLNPKEMYYRILTAKERVCPLLTTELSLLICRDFSQKSA